MTSRPYNVYTRIVDVVYLCRGQTFIWDGRKAVENRAKHGVAFETACEAFFDRLGTYFDASVPAEVRQALVGLSESFDLLYVVHLERDHEFIRIISAREAMARERKIYENGG